MPNKILLAERILLQTLCFDLQIAHPYRAILQKSRDKLKRECFCVALFFCSPSRPFFLVRVDSRPVPCCCFLPSAVPLFFEFSRRIILILFRFDLSRLNTEHGIFNSTSTSTSFRRRRRRRRLFPATCLPALAVDTTRLRNAFCSPGMFPTDLFRGAAYIPEECRQEFHQLTINFVNDRYTSSSYISDALFLRFPSLTLIFSSPLPETATAQPCACSTPRTRLGLAPSSWPRCSWA